MSEQDDADVVEQAPRKFDFPAVPWLPALPVLRGSARTRRRLVIVIAAACALLVTAATVATFLLTEGPGADPALAGLVTEVTTVPVGESVPGLPGLPASSGAYSSMLLLDPATLHGVSGPPLTDSGKPEVLYVATEYCPYCAIENWPLIVALSRFGRFTGLATSRTPEFEHIAPVDSWTFYGSHYTSPYLAFVPVERYSNILVNAKADPSSGKGYRALQPLTPAQQAILAKYDKAGSTPFVDFGNRAVRVGSGPVPVRLMTGKPWTRLAAALRQPKTELGASLLFEADWLTAEFCRLTGDRPSSACPAFLQGAVFAS